MKELDNVITQINLYLATGSLVPAAQVHTISATPEIPKLELTEKASGDFPAMAKIPELNKPNIKVARLVMPPTPTPPETGTNIVLKLFVDEHAERLVDIINSYLDNERDVEELRAELVFKVFDVNDQLFDALILKVKENDPIIDYVKSVVYSGILRTAREAKKQDIFVAQIRRRCGLTRDRARDLYKACRDHCIAKDAWPTKDSVFERAVTDRNNAKIDAKADPEKGVAKKQLGKAAAAESKSDLILIAKRIANELAIHGPITIDDVTTAMAKSYKVNPNEAKTPQKWKGNVFNTADWVAIGNTPSRMVEAHGRPVMLWAKRGWLTDNSLNGHPGTASAFNMFRIFNDFRRRNPSTKLDICLWHIGEEGLSKDILSDIITNKMSLYGTKVVLVPGATGALLSVPKQQYVESIAQG